MWNWSDSTRMSWTGILEDGLPMVFFLTHCIKWCWGLKGGSWILFPRGSWYLFSLLPIVFRDKIQVYLLFCNSYHFDIGAISCPVFPDVKPLITTPLQLLASPCAFELNISHLICPVTWSPLQYMQVNCSICKWSFLLIKMIMMHKNLDVTSVFWLSYCSLWEGETDIQEQWQSLTFIMVNMYWIGIMWRLHHGI